LNMCIEDVSMGDNKLRQALIIEISEHLNGFKAFHELSFLAQRAYEIFETENENDVAYGEGHYGHPDDDYAYEEEYETADNY
jgi:hypothetical protein